VTRVASVGQIGSVGLCPTLPLWIRRLSADVIVVHEPNPVVLVSMVLARPRATVLVWFHSEVVRPRWKYRLLYRPFLRAVLRRAARIIVSSPELARHLRRQERWAIPLDGRHEAEQRKMQVFAHVIRGLHGVGEILHDRH